MAEPTAVATRSPASVEGFLPGGPSGRQAAVLHRVVAARSKARGKSGAGNETAGEESPFTNFEEDAQIDELRSKISLLIDSGRYDAAVSLSRELTDRVKLLFGPRHTEYVKSLNNLAWLLQSRGDYSEARRLFEEALSIQEKSLKPDDPRLATVYNNLASLLMFQGDYQAARTLFTKALTIQEASLGSRHPDVARTLANLAVLLENLGERSAALHMHRRAHEILESAFGADHADIATSLNNLAAAYQSQGKIDEAKKLYQQALSIRERALGKEHPDVAQSLMNVAALTAFEGDLVKAAALLERSLSIYKDTLGDQHPDVAATLNELGKVKWRTNDLNGARGCILEAAAIMDKHINDVLPALSFAEQKAFLTDQVPEETSLLLSAFADCDELPRAYEYILRWKGLLVEALRWQANLRRLTDRSDLSETAQQLTAVRQKLADWFYKASTTTDASRWRATNQALVAEKELLERSLAQAGSAGGVKDVLAGMPLSDFCRFLKPDEAIVDIIRYRYSRPGSARKDTYAAIVCEPGATVRLINLGNAGEIDHMIRDWRRQVIVRNEGVKQWQTLKSAVWDPVTLLLPAGCKRVWVNPDSELSRIPWHLFDDRADNAALVSQLNSNRELARLRMQQPYDGKPAMLIVGGIEFGGAEIELAEATFKFPDLPGTLKEAEAIKNLCRQDNISTVLLTGSQPTKPAILRELPAANWIHLATHGFFLDERDSQHGKRSPLLESGLLLARPAGGEAAPAGQFLTAEELVSADLSRARLVTLSACETGLGEEVTGQGVLGLRASIMAAGSRCIVMSLWKVPDDSTLLLMNRFYENMWREKLPIAEALRRAQLSVRDEPYDRYKNPVHWAGWVCVGDAW